jgi:RNA polymerase sigma-70 factor, ECF subfamily
MGETAETKNPEESETTDQRLVSACRFYRDLEPEKRNEFARLLYEKFAGPMRAVVKGRIGRDLSTRIEADDIVQSTFKSFFRRAAKSGYEVPSEDELWRLLLVMAVNKVRKRGVYHRAAKRDVRKTFSAPLDTVKDRDRGVASELVSLVDELIADFTDSDKEIVNLRMQGCSVDEIHNSVERSKRTVERVLQRFRQLLASRIEENHDEPER